MICGNSLISKLRGNRDAQENKTRAQTGQHQSHDGTSSDYRSNCRPDRPVNNIDKTVRPTIFK